MIGKKCVYAWWSMTKYKDYCAKHDDSAINIKFVFSRKFMTKLSVPNKVVIKMAKSENEIN